MGWFFLGFFQGRAFAFLQFFVYPVLEPKIDNSDSDKDKKRRRLR
jgi:hypothetical protein